jgi:hypothetical protein
MPYIAWLAIRHIRKGSLMACTRCNPSIPLGGIVGESKWDILRLLPQDSIVPSALIGPAPTERRTARLDRVMRDRDWTWPIILKPDVGERGRAVRRIRTALDARRYLENERGPVIAQVFHPGPLEAGIFYARLPTEGVGRIFSITDKRFASVTGDGHSTVRTLIWRHSRCRAQAAAHLANLGEHADSVPRAGEQVELGAIGNHCRGAMFLEGAHLITPQLTAAIDSIAQRTPGFYFGRFDVRYSDLSAFKAGRGFQIVELNGLLSESTNIYDPVIPFWRAQGILREQWRLAFRVGAANIAQRRRGSGRPVLASNRPTPSGSCATRLPDHPSALHSARARGHREGGRPAPRCKARWPRRGRGDRDH